MIYVQPIDGASFTLPEDKRHGWETDALVLPRNVRDQRVVIDGTSYQVRVTNRYHTEFRDRFVEMPVWEIWPDPAPTRSTPYW